MKRTWILALFSSVFLVSRAVALTVQVAPTQPTFILGEPIRFRVSVTNDSAKSISLRGNPSDDWSMGPGISIEFHALPAGVVYGAAQVSLDDEDPVDIHLPPGQTYREKAFLRLNYIRVLRPGAYQLPLDVCLMGNRIHPFNPYLRLPTKLVFTVLPPNPRALMTKMDNLKEKILRGTASERDWGMQMLLQFSDPASVGIAGEIYSQLTPEGQKKMIVLSELNFDLGRKYLEEFESKTSASRPEIRSYLKGEIANFEAGAKFDAAFFKAARALPPLDSRAGSP
jgi:hypothetical protein